MHIHRNRFWLSATAVLAMLSPTAPAAAQPPIEPSKETTLITEPLRPDGSVDYFSALETHNRRGVTPDNNAAILFFQAIGPESIDKKQRTAFFAALGIQPLADNGEYFIPFSQFVRRQRIRYPESGPKSPDVQQEQAMDHPWDTEDYPLIAAWLAANKKPLDLIEAGSRRGRFYLPLADSTLIGSILTPGLSQMREVQHAFAAQAMLHLGTGDIDAAHADLMTARRTARHEAHSPFLIGYLVGTAMEGMVDRGEVALAQSEKLTEKQAARFQSDLKRLPARPELLETLELSERYFVLDELQYCASGKVSDTTLGIFFGNFPYEINLRLFRLWFRMADWNQVARIVNAETDRDLAALRKPFGSEQASAFEQRRKECAARSIAHRTKWQALTVAIMEPSQTLGDCLSDFNGSTMPNVARLEPVARAKSDLIIIAYALTRFHLERGKFPEAIGDLVPKYLRKAPLDPFAATPGATYRYRRQENGYVLYSIGPEGKGTGEATAGIDELTVHL